MNAILVKQKNTFLNIRFTNIYRFFLFIKLTNFLICTALNKTRHLCLQGVCLDTSFIGIIEYNES